MKRLLTLAHYYSLDDGKRGSGRPEVAVEWSRLMGDEIMDVGNGRR